jgi:hypothetical protein
LPKFVHRKYTSLVNIDVGTVLKITQQKKTHQNHEKKYLKKILSNLPTLVFSRHETGITGIFFRPKQWILAKLARMHTGSCPYKHFLKANISAQMNPYIMAYGLINSIHFQL